MRPIYKSLIISVVINILVMYCVPGARTLKVSGDTSEPIMISVVKVTSVPVKKPHKKIIAKKMITLVNTVKEPVITKKKSDKKPVIVSKRPEAKSVPEKVAVKKSAPVCSAAKKEEVVETAFPAETKKEAVMTKALAVNDSNKQTDDVIETAEAVMDEPAAEPDDERLASIDAPVDTIKPKNTFKGPVFTKLTDLTTIPSVKSEIVPEYPEHARRMNKEGMVKVELSIDTAGDVLSAKVIKSAGHGFDEAALSAVRVAKFNPALIGDRPVPVRVVIPIKFELK